MITKRERRLTLMGAVPMTAFLVLVIPYLDDRTALGVATVLLAMSSTLLGAAIAAPIQPSRK